MQRSEINYLTRDPVKIKKIFETFFGDFTVYIRRLQPDDARQMCTLIETSDYVSVDETLQFGIFNSKCELIGLYPSSEEAFRESYKTKFVLQWIH